MLMKKDNGDINGVYANYIHHISIWMVFLNGNMPEPNGVFRWDTTFLRLILMMTYD